MVRVSPPPEDNNLIKSPLNYTGGKFRLLSQILPRFPDWADVFVDLFCGGCNVGLNADADQVMLNDVSPQLIGLYGTFRALGKDAVLDAVDSIITKYSLSRSSEHGYAFYNCDSSAGLAGYNRVPFLRLREDFNKMPKDPGWYITLYVIIVYAFNNQIRFNAKGGFNLPVGKRDFNNKIKNELCAFINRLQEGNYILSCADFRDADLSALTKDSIVYCDPPYLIACASYNERNGWNAQCEQDLLDLLDKLNKNSIRFALSNVLSSKGRKNDMLAAWAVKYNVINLEHSYANSSYHTKDKTDSTREVLIVNY